MRPKDVSPRNQIHVDHDPASGLSLCHRLQEWSVTAGLSLSHGKALCHR